MRKRHRAASGRALSDAPSASRVAVVDQPQARTEACLPVADPVAAMGEDDALLELVRDQWRAADWGALAGLPADVINRHPQRARLAIMVASAHLAMGHRSQTLLYAQLARQWGGDVRLLARVLAASVHDTLGRAASIDGRHDAQARAHFEQAVAPGASRQALKRLAARRAGAQAAPLGRAADRIPGQPSTALAGSSPASGTPDAPVGGVPDLPVELAEDWAVRLRHDGAPRSEALTEISLWMRQAMSAMRSCDLSATDFVHRDRPLVVMHVSGDYIPRKIATERNFYEHRFLAMLEDFHRPGGLVVDIGANIGNHTLYFAAVMGASVLAIEPEPHNATCLRMNVVVNRVADQVKVVTVAIGERPGVATLQMNVEANFGSFSARPEANPSRTAVQDAMSVTVPVTTLDALLGRIDERQPVSLLKFDIEGMELDALRGATDLLKRMRPAVAVECFSRQQLTAIESELAAYSYFPVEFENATPTFIFLSRDNTFHMERLADRLREGLVARAMQRKGFG